MPAYNLTTLRAMARDRLDNNAALYTDPEIDYVINEAIRTCALFTGFFRNTVQVPGFTVKNQRVYTSPAGIFVPTMITLEGREVQKTSLRRLARNRREWATATTDNYGDVDFWAPAGFGKFVISPIDSVGGSDLTITGLATPPLMVDPVNDLMVLENEYVEIVTSYVEHRMPLKIGGKIFADGSLALNEFYAKVNDRKRYEGLKTPKYKLLDVRQEKMQ